MWIINMANSTEYYKVVAVKKSQAESIAGNNK